MGSRRLSAVSVSVSSFAFVALMTALPGRANGAEGIPRSWHTYQGSREHDGFVPVTVDPTKLAERWSLDFGDGSWVSQATGGDGYVLFNVSRRLYAVDSRTGTLLLVRDFEGVGFPNPPAYANGRAYVQTKDSPYVWAYDLAAGEMLFRSAYGSQSSKYYAPTIDEGKVYVGGGQQGGMYAFDATTGSELWFAQLPFCDHFTPAVNDLYAIVYTTDSERLGGQLTVVDKNTGARVGVVVDRDLTPASSQMLLAPVVGSLNNVVVAWGGKLASFDLSSPGIAWQRKGQFVGQPSVARGVVYAINGESLAAHDEATGARLWAWIPPETPIAQATLVTENLVFIGAGRSTYAVDLATHTTVWSCGKSGNLSFVDGALLIAGSNQVTALELEPDVDGDGLPQWWERRYGGDLDPVADDDGDGLAALEEYARATDPTNADSDGDDLSDGAEVTVHGTNPNDRDSDEDGLSDLAEVTTYGSEPRAFDTDGDGVDDGAEAAHGLDPRDAADGAADFDGDGACNRHEVYAGTDAHDGASFPALSEWGMEQGGPGHGGFQPLLLDARNFALRWTATRAEAVSRVATGGGKVFFAEGTSVVALDQRTGAEAWVRAFEEDLPPGAPSFTGDRVYVHTGNGLRSGFRALRADDGEEVLRQSYEFSWGSSAPTILGDRSYSNAVWSVGSSRLVAFDALSGAESWSRDCTSCGWWLSKKWSPAVDEARVLLFTGRELWVLDRPTGTKLVVQSAIVPAQTPVVGSRGNVLACGATLTSFDIATGKTTWEAVLPGGDFQMPAVGNGAVYRVQAGGLVAVSESEGAVLWQWRPEGDALTSNIVVTVSHVFVGGAAATYAIDVSTHELAWSYPAAGSLAMGNDGALFIAGGATVTAIEVEGDPDGDGLPQWWERRHGGDFDAAGDIDADGLAAPEEYAHGSDPKNADSDGDGLSDGAEVLQHGTNPAARDSDGDGLADADEIAVYGSDPAAADTDGDGIDDGEEVEHGLDPCDSADAAADPDGDGIDSRREALAGTDPHDGASFPAFSDWGMVQGNPRHDGCQPLVSNANFFAVRWTRTLEGTATSAAIGDGKVFVVRGTSLVALDENTGAEKYAVKFTTPAKDSSMYAPSFANGFVYIHTNEHKGAFDCAVLYALRKDDGELVFKVSHGISGSSFSAPTIFADRAYVNAGRPGGTAAFDALTGASLWSSLSGAREGLCEPAVDGERVLVAGSGPLVALDPLTGTQLFAIDKNGAEQTPVLGSRGNVLLAGASLASFDLATRKAVWEIAAVGTDFQLPAVGNGVVLSVQGGGLVAVREATGERLWRWWPEADALSSNLVVTASHVFVGSATTTYAIDLRTGREVWRYAQGGALALGMGGALIITSGATVTAIEVEGDTDGDGLPQWWERAYGGHLDPAADADGDGLTTLGEYEHRTDPGNGDSDGDGLSDGDEALRHGTNPTDADGDDDGVSDADEIRLYGSDPNVFDTDGDGMDDGLEVAHGLDPRDASDAAADFDGDGYGNRQEVLAGTDPCDGASCPVPSDWGAVQGGPSHRGYQPLLLDARNFALRWKVERSGSSVDVGTGGGKVFVVDGRSVAALDAVTGAEVWTTPRASTSYYSGPSFAHDVVYIVAGQPDNAFLGGLRADTGKQVLDARPSGFRPTFTGPTIFGERIYLNGGSSQGVMALDALTGAKVWNTVVTGGGTSWEPAVDQERVFAVVNGFVRVLDRLTGAELFAIEANVLAQTPVLGSRGNVLSADANLASFDLATRKAAWKAAATGADFKMPAVGNGCVFSLQAGELVAVREVNGDPLWRWRPATGALTSNLIVTVSHIFVANEWTTYAVDVATHEAVWSYPSGGTLALGNEGALLIAGGGSVTAIDVEGDSDEDGLPQWWERRYGGSLDAAADIDGDGLTALEEYAHRTDPKNGDSDGDGLADGAEMTTYGTDPNDPDSDDDTLSDAAEVTLHGSDPLAFDTDGDGLSDGAEVSHALDPRDASDGPADFDGDGYVNRHEALAGTDLRDGAFFPALSDWAMVQGNARHNGFQPFALDAADFTLRWKFVQGEDSSGVATGGGRVFAVGGRRLVAVDARTGTQAWVRSMETSASSSAPSTGNNLVYVHTGGAGENALWGFRQDTGARVFRTAHGTGGPSYGAPTVFGDRAYVNGGSAGGVQAFNALTGESLWTSTGDRGDYWEPAVDQDHVFATENHGIWAIDPLTGARQFELDALSSPQTAVLGNRGNAFAYGQTLASFDVATRAKVWEIVPSRSISLTPAVGNGIVLSVQAGDLVAVSEADGALLWRWRHQTETLNANIVATLSHAFVGSATRTYAIDLRTQQAVWTYAQGGTLALSKEGMLVIAGGGTLTAIELEGDMDGDGLPQWWERRGGGDMDPAADADGDGLTAAEEYGHGTEPAAADGDGDGLSDGAEVTQYGTNPNAADTDKDGLSDAAEVALPGSNPLAFDTDGDGIDDGLEVSYGLDPRDAADGTADFDRDGYDNCCEVNAGTDLRDGASFPELSDWGMLQGDPSHDGYQPYALDAAQFVQLWKTTRPREFSDAAMGGGKVYIVEGQNLVALDARTGAESWTRTIDASLSISAPSVGNGLVYVHNTIANSRGTLLGFREDTGELYIRVWHTARETAFSAPTIFADRAYVNGGHPGGLEAFNAAMGRSLWKTDGAAPGDYWEPAVDGERVLVVGNGAMRVLHPLTGTEFLAIDAAVTAQTPVLGSRGNVLVGGATLASFDIATGKAVWAVAGAGRDFGMPAVGNGAVFSIQDGALVAVSEVNGETLWQWRPKSEPLTSNIVATASHVFAASATATYAIDRATHTSAWSFAQGGTLALSKEGLLLITGGATLTAIEVQRAGTRFMRGDANADGRVDVADGVGVVYYLFAGLPCTCVSALDANDDGAVDSSDAVYVLYYLFVKGPPPPAPFLSCGRDPTRDALGCESYAPCRDGD